MLFFFVSAILSAGPAKVYFSRNISPDTLIKLYQRLNHPLYGNISVKISSGEPNGTNYLHPELIQKFVNSINGTIVECNTFPYGGFRSSTEDHWKVIEDHGFKAIAPCDIMDEDGEIPLKVKNGRYLKENFVGSHLQNYQSMVVLSHFKGHSMAGFGGAMKNMAIGIASSHGKGVVHCHGEIQYPTLQQLVECPQIPFLDTMAEAVSSILDFMGKENMVYINVANKLSIDCDCDFHPADPEMGDIGIFASLDPIAVDMASIDAVFESPDEGKASLVNRIEERAGIRVLERGEELGIGTRKYELIEID